MHVWFCTWTSKDKKVRIKLRNMYLTRYILEKVDKYLVIIAILCMQAEWSKKIFPHCLQKNVRLRILIPSEISKNKNLSFPKLLIDLFVSNYFSYDLLKFVCVLLAWDYALWYLYHRLLDMMKFQNLLPTSMTQVYCHWLYWCLSGVSYSLISNELYVILAVKYKYFLWECTTTHKYFRWECTIAHLLKERIFPVKERKKKMEGEGVPQPKCG